MTFYVIETFWMQEAAVREEMRRRNFETVYPTYMAARRKRADVVKIERPLFGPYLFTVFEPEQEKWKELSPQRIRGLRRVICSRDGNPVPVAHADAARLLERCAAGPLEHKEIKNYIKAGQPGLVVEGMLEGLQGCCKWVARARQRAGIELKMLGGYQTVDIPLQWIKPLVDTAAEVFV